MPRRITLWSGPPRSPARPWRTRAWRPRGIIMVITLLALLLLAALVFYVMNLGEHAARRINAQNAADASAQAGAAWIARSFNVVAMNNTTTAYNLALINVLDALPQATAAALREQQFLLQEAQDLHGLASTNSAALNGVIDEQLSLLETELAESVTLLQPVDALFERYDIRQVTHYQSDYGRGRLWQSMRAMEDLSIATLENLAVLAQLNAVRAGVLNVGDDNIRSNVADAFMSPLLPSYEFRHRGQGEAEQQTTFDDFRDPVTKGRLPLWADHELVNRGPYDALYHWVERSQAGSNQVVGTRPGVPGSTTGVDIGDTPQPFGGRPAGHGGGGGPVVRTGWAQYRTYGPYRWLLNRIAGFAGRGRFASRTEPASASRMSVRTSRLNPWVRGLADAKLNWLWSGAGRYADRFAFPSWSDTYPPAPDSPPVFSETCYYRLDIKSRYPRGHASFMSNGSWAFERRRYNYNPNDTLIVIERRNDWWVRNQNPTGPDAPPYLRYPHELNGQLANTTITPADGGRNRIWLSEYPYTVLADADIGIAPQFDAAGNRIEQEAYFIQVLMYVGINENPITPGAFRASNPPRGNQQALANLIAGAMGDPNLVETIENPHLGFDHAGLDAVGPVDFDHTVFGKSYAELEPEYPQTRQQLRDYVRDRLTFLGVARQGGRAVMWSAQFDRYKPENVITSIAQVSVFNNRSFDLWTQMWQSQLEPVDDFSRWAIQVQVDASGSADLPFVHPERVGDAATYLESLTGLAELGLRH